VQAWYNGWKSLFPPAAMAAPGVEASFHTALDVIEAGLDGAPLPALPDSAQTSFDMVYSQLRKLEQRGRTDITPAKPAVPPNQAGAAPGWTPGIPTGAATTTSGWTGISVSFRDAVEALAEKRGLSLLPNPRRQAVEGNAVYSLGDANVYFSGSVMFVENKKGGSGGSRWIPTGVDDLLQSLAGS
jgi:hypothetical protein